MRNPRALLVLLGVIVIGAVIAFASCGGGEPAATTTAPTTVAAVTTLAPVTTSAPPSTTTTTTSTTTTTTTLPPSPVNGAGVADETALDRRVIAVKIDNHPDARPQSGLQDADAVIELLVEGGLTRFIALFHSTDIDYVGPIRSVRPTDPRLVRPLGATLQISGGQNWIKSIVRREEVPFIGETGPNTFRIPRNGRAYERTLFGTTEGMRERADRLDYPDAPPEPWFEFGDPITSGAAATDITLDWSSRPAVRWEWDGAQYVRFNGSDPHEWVDADGEGAQIATDTLLVLTARLFTARPGANQSGSSVPAMSTVGTGQAIVFSGGFAVEGTWTREQTADPFTLTLVDGSPLTVPAGRLWVSVFPGTRSLRWE